MALRQVSDDDVVEIIVDPDFCENVIELALTRVVWIVESPVTKPQIDLAWELGKTLDLCEVNRVPVENMDAPEQNFLDILPTVHQHSNWSYPRRYESIVVRGVSLSDVIRENLENDYGFTIQDSWDNGFSARVNPDPNFGLLNFT